LALIDHFAALLAVVEMLFLCFAQLIKISAIHFVVVHADEKVDRVCGIERGDTRNREVVRIVAANSVPAWSDAVVRVFCRLPKSRRRARLRQWCGRSEWSA